MSEVKSLLNVLTIDGSDFQGQTTLLILSKLMETIARERKKKLGEKVANQKHLRPCDVFDVIGGVGIGGWIALLLSVFRMSIRECMNEYIKITQVIIRPDKLNEKVKKLGRSEYDITILENHVDRLAEEYKTGKNCFEAHRDLARCKRSFVVARYRDQAHPRVQDCLFKTYRTDHAGDPQILEPNPEETRLSEAFAATAAMKGCLYPFKLKLYGGEFGSDTFRGCFTNATTPALNQISKLSAHTGPHFQISALVNIAPPVPSPADLYKIKHQGSWASVSSKSSRGSTNSERDSETTGRKLHLKIFRRKARSSSRGLNHTVVDNVDSNGNGNSLKPNTNEGRNVRASSVDTRTTHREKKRWNWREFPVVRWSFRSQKYKEIQMDLQQDRDEHVRETRDRLQQMDPEALYVPLAPTNAPEKTALNDASALPEAQSKIDDYLRRPGVQESLTEAAVRILEMYGRKESSTQPGPGIS